MLLDALPLVWNEQTGSWYTLSQADDELEKRTDVILRKVTNGDSRFSAGVFPPENGLCVAYYGSGDK